MTTATILPSVIETIFVNRWFTIIVDQQFPQEHPLPNDYIIGKHRGCNGDVRRVKLEEYVAQIYCRECGRPEEVPYYGGIQALAEHFPQEKEVAGPEHDHRDG